MFEAPFSVFSKQTQTRQKQLNLALQGGGAHGAFTAGVLDRLLTDSFLTFDVVSGTSAGAVNAVALAFGYAQGGAEGARACLRAVWADIGQVGDQFQSGGMSSNFMTQALFGQISPYTFNPFDYDPLRDVLSRHIDFAVLRANSPIQLYIAATKASTGAARLFTTEELSLEAVLASCCLPFVSKAVIVEGEAYWDGAFSANPALRPVVESSNTDDTLIVQLSDLNAEVLPTNMAGIRSHLNRLSFHQSLRSELSALHHSAEVARAGVSLNDKARRLARHRFHLIDGSGAMAHLAVGSELTPSTGLITDLQQAGMQAADSFLNHHRADIGQKASINLKEAFDL